MGSYPIHASHGPGGVVITELTLAFVTGIAGSLHCLGMCGPLVIAYSLQLRGGSPTGRGLWSTGGLMRHLTFHLGRTITYACLGALLAGLVNLGDMTRSLMGIRNIVTIGGGVLMVLSGLMLLRVIPLSFASAAPSGQREPMLTRFIRARLSSPGRSSGLTLGLATGFLPCMFSWAMVVKAATLESPLSAFFFMAFFGLGTAPVLLFTGFSASLFSVRTRLAGERLAAASIIAMGLILLWKGAGHLV